MKPLSNSDSKSNVPFDLRSAYGGQSPPASTKSAVLAPVYTDAIPIPDKIKAILNWNWDKTTMDPLGNFGVLAMRLSWVFGSGDGCERRDMAVVVRQGVHFDTAPGLTERGPWKKRRIKLDGGGVQAEQPGFETKFMLWSFCRAGAYISVNIS